MQEKFSFKKEHRARTIFHIFNALFFLVVLVMMLVPIIKVVVDSFEGAPTHGIRFWPAQPTTAAYKLIVSQKNLYRPFIISIITTAATTVFGLLIATSSGFVLLHTDMPGHKLMSQLLLFTMIFSGGMIPTYLVMRQLKLLNTLWVVILPAAINVYNIILMRNFLEGIPESLFEAAEIDGATPMGVFWRIVLPLAKPALASIGLFYAVAMWNSYTPFVLYITDTKFYNFQVKLRELIVDDQSISSEVAVYGKTVQNAAIVAATVPFMLIYPFLQKYFIAGVTMGAVKE